MVQSYRQSDFSTLNVLYWMLLVSFWSVTAFIAMYMAFNVAAPSSRFRSTGNIQHQECLRKDLRDSVGIWIVFALSILFLIPSAGVGLIDDKNIAVTTPVLVMLAVSSWIAATTPMVAHDKLEQLVPLEDPASVTTTSSDDGHDMV